MTSNGKIDQKYLTSLLDNETLKRKCFGENSSETLPKFWEKYLGMIPTENDKFVEHGGDSHLAVLLSRDLEDVTGYYFILLYLVF